MSELINMIHEKIYRNRMTRFGNISKNLVGHMVAGIVSGPIGDEVVIGYSLLNKKDRYNVINGKRCPGHGKSLAISRAIKWKDKAVIEVPSSIKQRIEKFGQRCDTYFQEQSRRQEINAQSMTPKES